MKCVKCDFENEKDARYCENCGERLTKVSAWQHFRSHVKILVVGLCLLLLIIIGLLYVTTETKETPVVGSQMKSLNQNYVDSMEWHSPLGHAIYSGFVEPDTTTRSNKLIPHIRGIAKFISGEYIGCVYEGDFDFGKMEGRTKYTLKNGDIFIGLFKDNQYNKGKYIIKSSGEYFEGTFKDGEPDKGNWYDKNGNKN